MMVNADHRVPLYERCRSDTLDHAVSDRLPELAECIDLANVCSLISNTAPMLLERARRRTRS